MALTSEPMSNRGKGQDPQHPGWSPGPLSVI